jgi:hypothetical protein
MGNGAILKGAHMTGDRPGTTLVENLSPDDILALNKYQVEGKFHPFTCINRGDGNHRVFNGDLGALVATRRGWICPWCSYTQDWAHKFMVTSGKEQDD